MVYLGWVMTAMKRWNPNHAKRKLGRWIYISIFFFIVLAAYIHFVSYKTPAIGIELKPSSDTGGYFVTAVDEIGKAVDWNIKPGDRVIR